jgi:cytochrome c oxidase assembly protein subunit 11
MTALAARNARTGAMALLLAVAMVGVGFAAVPLYRLFCQVTGFGGTTRMALGAQAPGAVAGSVMSVRFDANHRSDLPWRFVPEINHQTIRLGERTIVNFIAKNLSDKPVTGTATFNVTPTQSGQYFTKVQCFCFTEQTLQPGEEIRMPVTYFVDPRIMDDPDARDIKEITLSYTFYPVDEPKKQG